jgi:hypothetical protein
MTITRMVVSLSGWPAPLPAHSYDERGHTGSTPCADFFLQRHRQLAQRC